MEFSFLVQDFTAFVYEYRNSFSLYDCVYWPAYILRLYTKEEFKGESEFDVKGIERRRKHILVNI